MTNFLINVGVPKLYAGDVSLFLTMILAGIVLMFLVKKTKLGAFTYAVYASYFITKALYFDFMDKFSTKILVFLGLAFGLHYLLFKPTVVVKLGGRGMMKWVRRIFIAFLIIGLMATIILSWMPKKEVLDLLSPFSLKIFTTKSAQLLWAIIPLLTLFAIRKKD